MALDRPTLFEHLDRSRRVILAGCGGGFDLYCALPLYFHLKQQGKEVSLVSLSFTDFRAVTGRHVATATVEVDARSGGPDHYFPEGHLCRWFQQRGEQVSIYCISPNGVIPLRAAYGAIVKETGVDTIVAVDGGTDSLMRGDEAGLGTPAEDLLTLAAVAALPQVEQKLLVCLGFGVDAYHGVCHRQVLEAVAQLSSTGDFLGSISLTSDRPEVSSYMDAVGHAEAAMPRHPSIVNASVVSALEGRYGDYHRTHRTAGGVLWINPLMAVLWAFQLCAVAGRCLYLDELMRTHTLPEVHDVIRAFRQECSPRHWEAIPH